MRKSLGAAAAYFVFLLAAAILLGAIRWSHLKNQQVVRAYTRQAEFKQLSIQLANASDYLTDEVRKYVVTTDSTHLNNYWHEIELTRTRDKVLARLEELEAPAVEFEMLARAKSNSDALVATETRGMRLILAARGVPTSRMPPPVATYSLSAADRALPAAAKINTARQIQFGKQYDRDKALIMGPIAQFQAHLNQRTNQEVAFARSGAESASRTLTAAAILAIVGMTTAFLIFNLRTAQRARRVQDTIALLAASSQEIAAAMMGNQQTVAQQAAAVHQTTTTMDEFDASFRQTAILASDSSQTASQARGSVDSGNLAVRQTIEALGDLRQKVGAITEHIAFLSQQTSQIGIITSAVSDLANQTNMLSLNAAVEAARAGEHGRGFAIVAAEIRKLADQSKESAARIGDLVEGIQKATHSTVKVTEAGTRTVDEGLQLAVEMQAAFANITLSVDGAHQSAQQIAAGVQEQTLAIQQVLDAMTSINAGIRIAAEGIDRTQTSINTLNEAAQSLKVLA
jgi:methyl-accepting chemotaxis protein